jgi:hypothetical protein
MKRSLRAFCATVFEFEERALQTRLPLIIPPPPPPTYGVGFGVFWSNSSTVFTQEVSQQSSVATVILSHNTTTGTGEPPLLQVQVTTDPSSPYVGVNVGAVNQTVTFAPGQLFAELTVPIIAGAPNPGEVDVNLTVTPIDPSPSQDLSVLVPVDTLRILASDASIPPAIVATDRTPQGIELMFNKPMNPVQASNVHNYEVGETSTTSSDNDPVGATLFWFLSPDAPLGGSTTSSSTMRVPLRSASYDPADSTVTLIPRRRLTYRGAISVTQGHPARAAGGPNAGTGAAHGLVDPEGNPIDQTTTPGKFRLYVPKGYTPNLGYWEA